MKDIYELNASAALRLAAAQARHDDELESLQLLLCEKTESLGRVERALDLYQRTATATDVHDHRRSAKIPDPPTLSKGRSEYRVFKAKRQEKTHRYQATFRDEEHQLSYTMGFLAAEAYEIVSPLRQNREIKTVSDLHKCLDVAYEDPDRKIAYNSGYRCTHSSLFFGVVHCSSLASSNSGYRCTPRSLFPGLAHLSSLAATPPTGALTVLSSSASRVALLYL